MTLNKLKECILEYWKWYLLIIYCSGFFAWNYYLYNFGFFEFDLLQTRFLSAGVLIWFLPGLLFLFSEKTYSFFATRYKLSVLAFLLWFFLFVIYLFPVFPQYFGGAKPMLISLVTTSDTAKGLRSMNLIMYDGRDGVVESVRACKFYENSEQIILGFGNTPAVQNELLIINDIRVLIIDKTNLIAQSILPQNQKISDDPRFPYSVINTICESVRNVYQIDNKLKYIDEYLTIGHK